MRRRLFSIAAAVSLLLCLAAAGAWVRATLPIRDMVRYQRTEVLEWQWSNTREGLEFCATRYDRPTSTPAGQWTRSHWRDPEWTVLRPSGDAVLGFRWARGECLLVDFVSADGVSPGDGPASKVLTSWVAQMTVFMVPHWALVAGSSLLPLLWVVRRWRTRGHRRQGHCRGCGYDLRASPARCPECGRAVPAGAGIQTA